MPFKSYSFVIAAAVLTAVLAREQSRGTFDRVSGTYREWLAANSGGTTAVPPGATVFLSLSQNERDDFEGWPLTRLDYAVLAKNLARFEPRVLAMHPPLAWEAEDEFTAGVLRSQLQNLPVVVLGYPLAAEADEGRDAALPDRIPAVGELKGDPASLPAARPAGPLPETAIVPSGALLGFTGGHGSAAAPALLARVGARVVPSFSLQTVAAALGRTSSDLQAVLGSRVQIRGAGSASVPVDARGNLALPVDDATSPPLVRLRAGTLLLTGQPDIVLDNLPKDQLRALDALKNAVVVLGHDDSAGDAARTAATAASIIARFASAPAPPVMEYLLWALLILAGAAMMRHSRGRIVFEFIALTAAFMAGGLIVFQSTQRWVSPTIPLALIAAATAWGLAVPDRKKTGSAGKKEESPAS